MGSFCWLLIAFAAASAVALQQPAQLARETSDGAFRTVSSKMDELHAGLAKVKSDSLNAIAKQKQELELKLEGLQSKNRNVESSNALVAEDISYLRKKNLELRASASELSEETHNITIELEAIRSNISMAQEFIAKSVDSTGKTLHGNPELQVLSDLDDEDKIAERAKHHEKRLSDLQQLAGVQASMIQLGVEEEKKPATESLVEDLLSSWTSLSAQQGTSLSSMSQAFDEEKQKCELKYTALLQEQTELNITKQTEDTLNVKLQGAVAHLRLAHTHLLSERVALQRFAKRLGDLPIRADAPPQASVSLPSASASKKPGVGGFKATANWAVNYIDKLR